MNRQDPASKPSAINYFIVLFLGGGIAWAAFAGTLKVVSDSSFTAAKSAVELAINLVGIMALWLGLVRILEAGGFMHAVSRAIRPLLVRLFPDVPAEHPAMGAMVLNISANMLGLGNAATPLGIKAMVELNKLNPLKGVATNPMCLFLAINTSNVTLLPLGVIGLRAAAGSSQPASIFLPTLLATTCSTIVGTGSAYWFARRDKAYRDEVALGAGGASGNGDPGSVEGGESNPLQVEEKKVDYSHLLSAPSPLFRIVGWGLFLSVILAIVKAFFQADKPGEFFVDQVFSFWLMPILMLLIVSYGLTKGVKIYEALTDGAKQGFEIAVRIIPYLVIMLASVAVFRASGAMDAIASVISPLLNLIGLPTEVLPMALVRPLSGSGAFAVLSEIVNRAPDSYEAFLASTIMGSTETSFYVLAVYFGAVGVTRVRHALSASILADIAGVVAACLICRAMF